MNFNFNNVILNISQPVSIYNITTSNVIVTNLYVNVLSDTTNDSIAISEYDDLVGLVELDELSTYDSTINYIYLLYIDYYNTNTTSDTKDNKEIKPTNEEIKTNNLADPDLINNFITYLYENTEYYPYYEYIYNIIDKEYELFILFLISDNFSFEYLLFTGYLNWSNNL